MVDDSRIDELLEELLDTGNTPEEVCRDSPELLSQVQAGWQRVRALRDEVGELFPDSDPPTGGSGGKVIVGPPRIAGYDVGEELGRGGMGIVYKAWHRRLNRPVALKMLLAGQYARPHELERFLREAEAVAGLQHPNIVQVYDVGDADGRPYFTMELVEGGSLAQKLSGTPQSAHLAPALVATLAEAIQVAHDAGIVHRDLKPANVLLADCTPKISDFGLARRLEGGAGLTQSGVPVGTPSYMAPEQARGQTNSVGPAADVYALGAILYECLTGRPPFRAATSAETIQQVISQEPAPPSRLNDKVSRDLDTICLKCLSKEPDRRYASAAVLAEDLRRFAEGRPIRARPVGMAERSWRWGRRNPMAATLLATAVALLTLASGGGVWIAKQSARHELDLRKGVSAALAQAVSLRQQYHFGEARDLLEIAGKRLEPAGPDDLRQQVKQSRADLDLAEHLDAARVKAAMLGGKFDPVRAEPLYVSAFAKAGLGREGDDVEAVAARVRNSPVRAEIVAALDDWASTTPDRGRRAWLLAVARGADPDPARDRLRQPELWGDVDRLTSLAKEPRLAESLSPQLATALGRVSRESGGEIMALLTAVQAQFPHDFWVNFELGSALYEANRWDEALGYLRAAVSLRPTTSLAHQALGETLRRLGRVDEAIDSLREALRIDPDFVWGHICLGLALHDGKRPEEAIEQYRQALRIDPNSVPAHVDLGRALYETRRLDEALDQFEQARQIDPKSDIVRVDLGNALYAKGRRDEAMDQYQQALRINPKSSEPHVHIGIVLSKEGQMPEAVGHFEQALGMDPESERLRAWLGATRYRAACAAVRKATGPGSKNGHPDDTERAALRRQALGWLRANLEMIKQTNRGKLVMTSLATWQQELALASVRNPAELATLPTEEREAWQQLWADVAAIIAIHPLEQAYVQAARGQWNLAADAYARYSRVIKPGPTYSHFCFEYAALSLLSGDRTGYTKACSHMAEEIGKPGGPRAYHIARACTLAPDAVTDASLPGRLVAKELQADARQFWSLTEQGALAYRAGRFHESVPLFEQSLRANSKPGVAVVNWLWLALANRRLGKTEEARRWLDKAQAWLDQFGDGMPAGAEQQFGLDLHNWLEAHVLRREAEALIQSKDP